eukprot:6209980-Pleurochrysis_carterae.AAC.3
MRTARRRDWPFPVSRLIWPGSVPQLVPWISGVLAPADAMVVSAPSNDRWWQQDECAEDVCAGACSVLS